MSKPFINNDLTYNLKQIKDAIFLLKDIAQLICFGEAFLQGFDSLTWEYTKDEKIAIALDDSIIQEIASECQKYQTAVSFGFIEKKQDKLFCSYIVIDENGSIVDIYRRISIGWKEYTKTDEHYQEGQGFHSFFYQGIKISVALCGDLWYDENIALMNSIVKDIVLWPLYVNFSKNEWETELAEYNKQVAQLHKPVLFINSICLSDSAQGGCYVFLDNAIVEALPLGSEGYLIYEIEEKK